MTASQQYHTPVMVDEVLDLLQVGPGGRYCDCTVGGGGHAARILELCAPDGELVGLDRDPAALARCRERLGPVGDRVTLEQSNLADAVAVLARLERSPVDGMLVDLGVSSHQLDTPERGFSLGADGPLDMRMDPTAGETAAELIQRLTESELAEVIWTYGEEPGSRRLARAIKRASDQGRLSGTLALARVVAGALRSRGGSQRRSKIHPATRTFQALRMAVNDELASLRRLLETFLEALRPGGRLAVIAFHSLEDRLVKQRFNQLANPCTCPPDLPVCCCGLQPRLTLLTRKPRKAAAPELAQNPRARSARLRAAEKLA